MVRKFTSLVLVILAGAFLLPDSLVITSYSAYSQESIEHNQRGEEKIEVINVSRRAILLAHPGFRIVDYPVINRLSNVHKPVPSPRLESLFLIHRSIRC
ncbi:MAG: hypothetical protein MUC73_03845 [Cyclobacteriaceae bacterium]|nr:hypothetical protein [Cyclobacteriaceae bacterium]